MDLKVPDKNDQLLSRIQELESENKHLVKIQMDFENLLSTGIDGIWCKKISKKGKEVIKFASENIEKIIGYKVDYLFEDKLKSVLHPSDIERYESHFNELFKGNNSTTVFEFRIIMPDSKIKWIKDRINIKFDKRGNSILTGILTDITEKKNIEEEFRKNTDELKDLNNTKDKFFSIIAHDLRNPFNAIMSFAEMLYEEYDSFTDEERKDFIHNIKEASDSTYKLLQNLLEWSRAQTGKISFNPEEFQLQTIIEETISLVKSQSDKKSIKINMSIKDSTIVYADKNMVRTILRNLITNAIKFTHKGGEIKIYDLSSKDFVKIHIKDSGIGIEEENISKLFKLDQKYRMNGTENEMGTGLGLIICKELVEINGGSIWVESEKEKGSSFIFTLPKI